MILSKGTRPENSLYFLGSEVLKTFKEINSSSCDVFSLYQILKGHRENYSFAQHLLALNWLFLLGLVRVNSVGHLELCL